MSSKEFNLLREPWIRVMKPDGAADEISMPELFRGAHTRRRLAGELPTQDFAVLRLLLAVLHAVFSRYDESGREDEIFLQNDGQADSQGKKELLRRWQTLWERGSFPAEVIERYLTEYEERFWLFHPQTPFYQAGQLAVGTDYSAAKLNGELSESGNKVRLFAGRSGNAKSTLDFAEAARWLLCVNGYDDTSSKPKGKGPSGEKLPSCGAGWLGQLGLIAAEGRNLFETLMLNFVILPDGGSEALWDEAYPVWEREPKADERTPIPVPNNQAELLTLQSRRLLLRREDDKVTGYTLLGGDFFPKENAFVEQMTVWRSHAEKGKAPEFKPRRHDPAKQLWRDYSSLTAQGQDRHQPGVITWLCMLRDKHILQQKQFRFIIAAMNYGDKDFFVDDTFADSITFNADLLTELSEGWNARIIDELDTTEQLVYQVGRLAQSLALAAGIHDNKEYSGSKQRDAAKEQAYYRLDVPFRRWLESIDPAADGMDAKCAEWWDIAKKIVRALGKELAAQCGSQAFVGRNNYSAPQAYNIFLYKTTNRQTLAAKTKGVKNNGTKE
ncbi:MAG: type I-E CRISPR-associated protein Cse1/CasA [Oscillospiraceae bacterium]|jgi:CRISPR system Cascade subunit CasA|nr:type I-E CRISPR-associated protein Cse1/CasA [Oscillospiraceae bacterium]